MQRKGNDRRKPTHQNITPAAIKAEQKTWIWINGENTMLQALECNKGKILTEHPKLKKTARQQVDQTSGTNIDRNRPIDSIVKCQLVNNDNKKQIACQQTKILSRFRKWHSHHHKLQQKSITHIHVLSNRPSVHNKHHNTSKHKHRELEKGTTQCGKACSQTKAQDDGKTIQK